MTKQQIRKALTCDKNCGHTLDPEICFEHQVERIENIKAKATAELKEKIIKILDRELKSHNEFCEVYKSGEQCGTEIMVNILKKEIRSR